VRLNESVGRIDDGMAASRAPRGATAARSGNRARTEREQHIRSRADEQTRRPIAQDAQGSIGPFGPSIAELVLAGHKFCASEHFRQ